MGEILLLPAAKIKFDFLKKIRSLLSTLISLITVEVGINVEGVQKMPNH